MCFVAIYIDRWVLLALPVVFFVVANHDGCQGHQLATIMPLVPVRLGSCKRRDLSQISLLYCLAYMILRYLSCLLTLHRCISVNICDS